MSDTNRKRRVRRKATNKKNEIQSKTSIKLDQKDQVMLQNAEGIRNQAITNVNDINNIKVQITSINRNLQQFEKSVQEFEQNEINPKFENINNRLDEVCNLLFDMADALAFEIEDERYAKLGFEIVDEPEIDDTDETEVEVLDEPDQPEVQEEIEQNVTDT